MDRQLNIRGHVARPWNAAPAASVGNYSFLIDLEEYSRRAEKMIDNRKRELRARWGLGICTTPFELLFNRMEKKSSAAGSLLLSCVIKYAERYIWDPTADYVDLVVFRFLLTKSIMLQMGHVDMERYTMMSCKVTVTAGCETRGYMLIDSEGLVIELIRIKPNVYQIMSLWFAAGLMDLRLREEICLRPCSRIDFVEIHRPLMNREAVKRRLFVDAETSPKRQHLED